MIHNLIRNVPTMSRQCLIDIFYDTNVYVLQFLCKLEILFSLPLLHLFTIKIPYNHNQTRKAITYPS